MEWTQRTVKARTPTGEFAVARPSLVFGAFGDSSTNTSAAAVLDWWLALIPENSKLTYLGANARAFREGTPRVLQRIRKVLQNDPDEDELYGHSYIFKDAPDFDCGYHALELKFGVEPDFESVNMVYGALPLAYLEDPGPERFTEAFTRLVETVSVRHAFAGFGFNLVWGREYEQGAMPLILATGQRYLGLDVRDRNLETTMSDRIKSAAWLTYLHLELIEKLGGQNRLDELVGSDVQRISTAHGLILRSSVLPPVGDANRGAEDLDGLRQIDRFIEPIREKSWVSTNLFRAEPSSADRWFTRLNPRK